MHQNELWQEYTLNGEPLMNGGRPSSKGNPGQDEPVRCKIAVVQLYRHNGDEIELLFQRRSDNCKRSPGKWDFSAGGHVNYAEPVIAAAVREAKEEIGASIKSEELIFAWTNASIQLVSMFFCNWTGKDDNFTADPNEVSDVKWVKLNDLDVFLKDFSPFAINDEVSMFCFKNFLEKKKYARNLIDKKP